MVEDMTWDDLLDLVNEQSRLANEVNSRLKVAALLIKELEERS